jgi:outer membrane protein assembly factor BamD
MRRNLLLVTLFLFALLIVGCSRTAVNETFDPRVTYDKAMELYEKGKYFKAQVNLQKLIYSYPGQTYIDTAQFHLGMSHFNMSNYSEAIGEFRRLLTAYPVSDYADDSYYYIGMSYFERSPHYARDQVDTYDCIDELSEFLNRYPDSPHAPDARKKLNILYDKLAKKMYKNGELYLKIGDYDPALIYFQQVRDNYPNTEWAIYAFYYSGEALMKNEQQAEALKTFQDFVITFPDNELAKKARNNISKLQKVEIGG